MSEERSSAGGGGAAFVLLIVVGAIAKLIWWILAVLGAIVLGIALWLLALAGDGRGIYGEYRPLMYPTG